MDAQVLLIRFVCIAVLGVICVGMSLMQNRKSEVNRHFWFLLLTILCFLIVELFCDQMEGNIALSRLNDAGNLLAFVLVDMAMISFAGYLSALLLENAKKREPLLNIAVAGNIARVIMVIVFWATGNLYDIVDGYYVDMKSALFPYFSTLIIMLFLLFIVTKNRKHFSFRQFVVMVLYLLMPVIPIVVELYTNLYTLTGIALTISVLMIYIMLQAGEIESGKLRENVLEELSSTDLLTGIGNRRAYYQRISNLVKTESVGIVFCDLNTLKYVNDHFGHTAGDKLIQQFAEMFSKHFSKSNVFRISGDEFVAILANVKQADFTASVTAFEATLSEKSEIASMGTAFGNSECFDRIVLDAEEEMYKAKKAYYHEKGLPQRHGAD